MRTVSFYHRVTGILQSAKLTASDDEAVALNTPPGCAAIDGHHDELSLKVDVGTGRLVDYQPSAPTPAENYVWNRTTKRWRLNDALTEKAATRSLALMQIAKLEASQHRPLRELVLGDESARVRVRAIEDEITHLRKQL